MIIYYNVPFNSSSGLSLAIAFIWLFFIQFFAKIMVWVTLILGNCICIAFSAYTWINWYGVKTENQSYQYMQDFVPSTAYNETTLLVIGTCTLSHVINLT